MLYWRGDEYLGVGAGAHSHIREQGRGWGVRRANIKIPGQYIKSVMDGNKPIDFSEKLKKLEALEDTVLMGLRLSNGIEFKTLRETYKVSPDENKLGHLVKGGLLELEGDSVRLTKKGSLLSNAVIERFLDALH